jgi:Ca2+-binding RTX toxin-like protein
LHGGDGFDTASYAGSEVRVGATLNGSLGPSGDAVGDTFISIEGLTGTRYNDVLVGNDSFNRLEGGRGSDVLSGLGGTDVLVGGLGRDSLNGGADSDRFVFTNFADSGPKASARDVIFDFVQGQDLIDLSAIDANTKKAGDQAFKLLKLGTKGSDVGTGKIGWYHVNKPGSANDLTILKINNDADAAVDMTIALEGIHTLTAADFVL